MILNFKVGGFCSINETQELTFTPFFNQRIKGTKYEKNYVLDTDNKYAKSVIIYGNNSTGKTNLLLAIETCLNIIRNGLVLERIHEFFSTMQIAKEICFELIINLEQDVFVYEIAFNTDQVTKENLEYNGKNIYSFLENKLSLSVDISNREQIEDIYSVRSTATILSKIKDFIPNIAEKLLTATSKINVLTGDPLNPDSKEFNLAMSEAVADFLWENKNLVLQLFQSIDKTITKFSLDKTKDLKKNSYEFVLYRKLEDSTEMAFNQKSESQGVKRMIVVISQLVSVIKYGNTLIIDEFDAPISTKSLLNIFVNFIHTRMNYKGQLIVTSHNLELFNLNYFAPSQIYITNKSDNLSTIVNSLADYNIRSDKKRLALRFLQGAFEL